MSEYWVSHKRYHCKYCNIYIADDKPSRQQHENGLRHKGNVERFVRGLYKEGEKRVREREEEKGIMASVGKAAEAAYALDVASGRAGAGSSSRQGRESAAAPKSKPKPGKPSDPYANYSTPASLGYIDPDAEAAQQRMETGTPGAWTVVAEVGEKRGAAEAEVGEDDGRACKLQRKTVGVGLGEIYDPAKIEPSEPVQFRKRKARGKPVE
ncbi:hypothetical protein HD554DRAFT_2089390 [Boletus coccyginus]|nr:hypothetical protein HD554DRAFT_2089390 [Boletus coccyginus]